MATAIGDLIVRLSGQSRGFDRTMTKARGTLGRIAGAARSTLSILAPLGGTALFAGMIRSGEQFNRSMRNSLAIMGDVSKAMRTDMKEAALEVARTTQFSAQQAAEAFFFLSSAGLDAQQSIAAMPQVAQFAQAGNFDLARATDLATDAQSALGLTVDDAANNLRNLTRVTDVLVKANTLANASVEQFSTALTQKAGPALKALGKEIEEGVAVLAAFADQGIKAERAGTALDIVLRRLQIGARENATAWERLGVQVFDSQGEFRNIADVVGQLEDALQGMSDQQKDATLAQLGFTAKSSIFIKTLLGTSDSIREYEGQLRKAGGTTRDVADKQLTALQKGLAELGAAWTRLSETIVTKLGPAMARTLKEIAIAVRTLVEDFETLGVTGGEAMGQVAEQGQRAATPVGFLADKVRQITIRVKALQATLSETVAQWFRFAEAVSFGSEKMSAMAEAAEDVARQQREAVRELSAAPLQSEVLEQERRGRQQEQMRQAAEEATRAVIAPKLEAAPPSPPGLTDAIKRLPEQAVSATQDAARRLVGQATRFFGRAMGQAETFAQTLQRAQRRAEMAQTTRDEFETALARQRRPQFAEAVEKGSAAAFSRVLEASGRGRRETDKQIAVNTKQSATLLDAILSELEEQEVVDIGS